VLGVGIDKCLLFVMKQGMDAPNYQTL